MRRSLGYLGLSSMLVLACGIKGPPRPPLPKAKVEVPAAPGAEVGGLEEELSLAEENLQFEEALQ